MTLTTPQTRVSTGAEAPRPPFRNRFAGHRPPERSAPPGVLPDPPASRPAAPEASGPTPGGVVLWGLPALYAHGLRDALLEAGHARVSTHDDSRPPPALTSSAARSAVVVVSTDSLADPAALTLLDRGVAVVELVADAGVATFTAAVRRGAAGVLDPATELEHAVEVVTAAAAGLVLVPDHVGEALTTQREPTAAPSVSGTERAWLRWLGTGGTVSALAASASYSEREMYRLLRKLYTHLGAGGRTEALLQAERWGLLDD